MRTHTHTHTLSQLLQNINQQWRLSMTSDLGDGHWGSSVQIRSGRLTILTSTRRPVDLHSLGVVPIVYRRGAVVNGLGVAVATVPVVVVVGGGVVLHLWQHVGWGPQGKTLLAWLLSLSSFRRCQNINYNTMRWQRSQISRRRGRRKRRSERKWRRGRSWYITSDQPVQSPLGKIEDEDDHEEEEKEEGKDEKEKEQRTRTLTDVISVISDDNDDIGDGLIPASTAIAVTKGFVPAVQL